MPKLILKFEAAVIKEVPILSSSTTVGRDADNDVTIDHPAVSRHHCRILLQGDTYFVEDLNSTNGTLVNGKKVIKAGVHNQDVISIAKHSLVFIDDRAVSAQDVAARQAAPPKPAATPPPKPAAPPPKPAVPPSAASSIPPAKGLDKVGGVRVIEGAVDPQEDFLLTENSTYIGKSERVTIKIKGMFAPDVAAMISKKPDGYVLVAIKDGYPKVNGLNVQGERILSEGDIIEVGSTKLQFYLKSV